jgi:hypothetical protein
MDTFIISSDPELQAALDLLRELEQHPDLTLFTEYCVAFHRVYDMAWNQSRQRVVIEHLVRKVNHLNSPSESGMPAECMDGNYAREILAAYHADREGLRKELRALIKSYGPRAKKPVVDAAGVHPHASKANQTSGGSTEVLRGLVGGEAVGLTPLEKLKVQLLSDMKDAWQRLANHFVPLPAEVVGTEYLVQHVGRTTTWWARCAREGRFPPGLVAGGGDGQEWQFHRRKLDAWIGGGSKLLPLE